MMVMTLSLLEAGGYAAIIFFVAFILTLGISSFYFSRISRRNSLRKVRLEEAIYVLDTVIEHSREKVERQLRVLEKKYDKSSAHLVNGERDILLKKEVSIILSHLSDDVKQVLLHYFSSQGLIVHILGNLS